MPDSLIYVLALAGLVLTSACADHKGPPFHLQIAHAQQGGACVPKTGAAIQDPPVTGTGVPGGSVTHLRISARTHVAGDAQGSFACDRVLPIAGNQQPNLRVRPQKGAVSVDLYVEAFHLNDKNDPVNAQHGQYRRVATGSLLNLPVNLTSPTPLPIVLYPTETFRCADSRLTQSRAFHSATELPNGMIFLYGGLIADPNDPTVDTVDGSERLYVTSTAEVYDPQTGQFHAVADMAPGGVARAFHHAALVGTTPPYQILLVGGVTTTAGADPKSEVLAPNSGGFQGRLVPFDLTNPPANHALATRGAQSDLISFDPTKLQITSHTLQPGFAASAFQAGSELSNQGIATADGINWTDPLNMASTVLQASVTHGTNPPRDSNLGLPRIGATLTPINDDTALLWGGGLNATDQLGEYLTGLGQSTIVSVTQYPTQAGVPMTWFHTASVMASDNVATRILVAGGFEVTSSTSNNRQSPPAAQALHLVTLSPTGSLVAVQPIAPVGGYVIDPSCTASMRYRPAGYQSAMVLPRGDGNLRVLITGGAPSFASDGAMNVCVDCDGAADPLCSTAQASLYSFTGGFVPTTEPMQIGRFGHSSTLLRDGTVLIVGGISREPGDAAARLLGDAEVYNPRQTIPPFDATKGMAAIDYDDPLVADIAALGLSREPGFEATKIGQTFPAFPCGDF